MMKNWILAALLAAALGGCATPPARFYGLDAASGPAAPSRLGQRVLLGPVTLPAALDRPQLVLDNDEGELSLQEFARWSAPLDRLLAQNLALGVSRHSGLASVYAYPQPGMDGGELRYVLDVRRLSLQPGRQVALEAVWQLQNVADGKVLAGGSFSRAQPVTAADAPTLLAALRTLLDGLSLDMAAPLREQPVR
ncbi:hypothetical protein C2134_18820 [Chromobacterium sinusclupearum]|uniref:ABC-type transport auxiliary lipoprotein component domain-containing protein n=1 Tax=Chromobacterium sinusclupearum TaxID=2077146 RepID=A0A2K4MIU5_9NEIS|nr:PqiC family protein [Chromobacterium sinusclupearum]POA97007.1 hypothetical protein C2134_18820 [Chromobacterium sinusclupearum]